MRVLLSLFLAISVFPADVAGLRDIHEGDPVPLSGELKFIEGQGETILLYLESDDLRSVAFLRQFLKVFGSEKKIFFVLVDLNPEIDKRVLLLFNKFVGTKKIINDPDRKIYGELGVVVMPTLMFIDENAILNSTVVGYRSNLGMFFRNHLKALRSGEKPGDVYGTADRKMAQRKQNRLAEQAFKLILDGNYKLAGSMYKKAYGNDPKDTEALLGYGFVLLREGKTDEAAALFSEVSENKNSKRVSFGLLLARTVKDPSVENLTELTKYALLEPSFFPAVYTAGEILEKNGQRADSIKVFKRSYRILLRTFRRGR